jgi:hypothetical protein
MDGAGRALPRIASPPARRLTGSSSRRVLSVGATRLDTCPINDTL